MDSRLSIIFSRRSVREYDGRPISEDDTQSILQAAMAAPSASNRKPWHFVTVTDRKTLVNLAQAQPYGKMLAGAALCIVVCGDPLISDWWVQDCSAATENILIAATALGLGAVWIGVCGKAEREAAVRDILGVPEDMGILSVVSIGYPIKRAAPRTQYDPLRVHDGKW